MRIQRILVGAALLMLCAAAAYAQVSVSSTPVTTVIASGRAENAGAIRISGTGGVAIPVADTITIRYGGLSITNALTTAVNISGPWACTWVSTDLVNGIVTISCPAAVASTDYFTLSGVRLNIDGYAGANVVASVGTLNNPVIAGQNTAVAINSIAAGLSAATSGTTATYMADWTAVTAAAKWTLTEGFASAWGDATQVGPGATAAQGTQIAVTVTGLPTGVSVAITNDAAVTSATITYAIAPATLTSSVTQAVITFGAPTNQAAIEKIGLILTPSFGATAAKPAAAATYLAYATMYPNQVALTSSGAIPSSPLIPRFATVNLPTAGFPFFTVTPNTTTFIIPYVSTALGYDTGIAIANTTADPFATGGAMKQDGSVTVTFYGNDGTTVTYNSATDTAKGTGLTSGVLKAGYTWTVLASELLAAKGRTTALSGYAIVVLNATNGHGQSYVSNFSGFTSGAPLLVLTNPVLAARTGATESLGN